jgi:hypothetical protein
MCGVPLGDEEYMIANVAATARGYRRRRKGTNGDSLISRRYIQKAARMKALGRQVSERQ